MKTKVKAYTFTAGTRQITVTDDITFAKADIAVIVNRTQQKVLFTIPDYNLITDVTNKVITYDNSLPVLAEGDVLWIEIDIEATTTKIIREPAIVTVVGADYHPNDWNLTAELAAHTPNDYPYCFAIKIPKSLTTELTGADAYYTSDGNFLVGNQTHTWTDSSDGYSSAYIIYAYATRDQSLNFISTSTMLAGIIEMLIDDLNVGMVTIGNFRFQKLWTTAKTTWNNAITRANMFVNNVIVNYVDIPSCTTLYNNNFQSCTNIVSFNAPNLVTITNQNWFGCTILTYSYYTNLVTIGNANWYGCTNLIYGYYPSLVTTGVQNWLGCTKLTTLTVGTLTSWTNNNIQGCTALTKLVIGIDTDINLDLRYGVALTADNIRDFIVPNLKDNTSLPAKTITFATAVYNNLVAAGYIALFTARNWNVAAA